MPNSNKNDSEEKARRRLPPELQLEIIEALSYRNSRRMLVLCNPTVYHRSLVQRQRRRDIDALVTRGVFTWTIEEVARWVNFVTRSDSNGDRFVEEEVDGSALLLLDQEHLTTDLNLMPGPAIELWSALIELKRK